ncbi:MAG: hypothetical protein QOF61_552 [Acidobacteriota bacterium]|nr:hypothetical protein [Acidobacteriota bacterium]
MGAEKMESAKKVDEDNAAPSGALVEGVDFYFEGAAIVFTKEYHLRRGYCCESGCRHCPFGFKKEARDDDSSTHERKEN